MAELTEIQLTTDLSPIAAVVQALDSDGACIVHGLLDEDACDRLLADFGPHLDTLDWGADDLGYRDDFYGSRTKRLHGLFSKSAAMESVLTHPVLTGVARAMIVDRKIANDIRLSNSELMVLASDQEAQMFHTDGASWYRAQQMDTAEMLVSANIALTPFTQTNGATRVVPGSHRWLPGREPTANEVCLAVMAKGSALVYSGKVIHSGGKHRDKNARSGLYLGYVASWLRPLENHLVTNSPDDVYSMSQEAQQLLDVVPGGFTVFA